MEPTEWTSSNENVASVDQNGNVTINGNGTAKITADFDGVQVTGKLKVKQ